MTVQAQSPEEYIESLPEERGEAVRIVRDVIRRNLPPGYEEGMQYGLIGWYVPLEHFPDTYNGQPLALGRAGQPEELHQPLPELGVRRSQHRALVQGPIRRQRQEA